MITAWTPRSDARLPTASEPRWASAICPGEDLADARPGRYHHGGAGDSPADPHVPAGLGRGLGGVEHQVDQQLIEPTGIAGVDWQLIELLGIAGDRVAGAPVTATWTRVSTLTVRRMQAATSGGRYGRGAPDGSKCGSYGYAAALIRACLPVVES